MSTLRYELICATKNRAITLTDTRIHNDIHKQFEFQRQTVLVDKILTYDEKTIAIKFLIEDYDRNKIIDNNENVESANQSWFEEAKSHLAISDSEKLPEEFIKLQVNSSEIIQQQMERKDIDIDDGEKVIIQQKMKRQNIGDIDDDEVQDELEIPDDGF
ncbi:kinase-like domain-containing protein [Rhizophagus irregularis DAOM 181602=DAOM 197198]|nr:kinase-like domain-containing protein [Rhizophagus irregularis DAOM 181602=DAOM 197198]